MKKFASAILALSLLGGTAALADPHGHDGDHGNMGMGHDGDRGSMGMSHEGDWGYDAQHRRDRPHWSRGDHFRGNYVVVDDWRGNHLRRPPRGYHWVRTDDGDFVLAAITTGVILDLLLNAH